LRAPRNSSVRRPEWTNPDRLRHRQPDTRDREEAGLCFPLLTHVKWNSPRPILFVTGEHAHSRYYSEDAYELAAKPKKLYIVPNAGHVDLYDNVDLIPFEKLEEFFTKNLAAPSSRAAADPVGSRS
jgi:hypothetical protein